MRPTPETDASEAHAKYWPNEVDWPNKCRKMERARDEAREESRGYKAAYDSAAEMCRVLKARLERYEDAAENADVCVPPPAADSLALADAGGAGRFTMTIDELVRKYDLRDGHRFMIERLLETGHTLEELGAGLAEANSDDWEPPGEYRGVGAPAGNHGQDARATGKAPEARAARPCN